MTAPLVVGILLLLAPRADLGGGGGPEGPAIAPAPGFEELWAAYAAAERAGDVQGAERALREIRRSRMERNVPSLDTLGLALVESGVAMLDQGRREEAEQDFRIAVDLAPALPDGHAGLAVAQLKGGPLGVVPSIRSTVAGLSAFLATGRGDLRGRELATLGALVLFFGFSWGLGAALLLRHGGLLRHDIEEWLGPAQSRIASLALFLLVLLLPVAVFQGWGWLPLWWLALLFAYLGTSEKVLTVLLLTASVAVGPLVSSLERRQRTARNPLFHAALQTVESVPDRAATARLEEAARSDPGDLDLVYLLGTALRRAGRYPEAVELFRQVLASNPQDAVARNNLANIEFVRGRYDQARARYREGTRPGVAPEVAATSYYNLSLAYLQKFEYQAYNEAKSNADRLAPGVVSEYDRWQYDSRDYAVVDISLDREDVHEKFAGAESGVAVRNVAAGGRGERMNVALSLPSRFVAFVVIFALTALLVGRWRGRKAFTLHCRRCGTAFCRSCHLGQASGSLCSQCYHLFVVRDGVSGPARNRKMAEVQRAETRRDRVFRALSVASPGAGQLYGGWTVRGAVLMTVWYGVAAAILASREVPLTEVAGRLAPPWPTVAGGLGLALAWAIANRFRPSPDVELPARPAGPRRSRPAPAE